LILTPSLASLPTTLDHRDTRIRNRHVDLLVNRRTADTLKLRSHIIQYIRSYLIAENFLEVQTPILADGAGGAAARPFITNATEFPERLLSLRIAPEIWLKRLVLGGMDRVFEIGSVFRNEGLDATHNPEFTTCEFYKSFADLEELIGMTESLISGLAVHVNELISTRLTSLTAIDLPKFSLPFNRIEFIPGIEAALGHSLPDLSAKTAGADLLTLFKTHSLPLPTSPTLPRLLDKLASIYLEPHCTTPTFITHHPSCLAPLSKSFICPTTKQLVSARVELFIEKSEMANMYEEENSPLEQRRKFVEQARWKDEENEALVDESYLEALEWGLPPTGGWGAGIDRICMLFTGAGRISDVLAFGSLRNVVGLGTSAVGDGKSDEN
jgi:lysyl-tRNA synthetase class 2